jgi:lysine 2,3-aminomutase
MKEKITPWLRSQLHNPAIALQYVERAGNGRVSLFEDDPLDEDGHEPVKGLVHKYGNRALVKVSYRCAAHCRFCTRLRQIGSAEGDLGDDDILRIGDYLRQHPEITDVILSGGDPFYTPKQTFELLDLLQNIETVRVVRIGSRLPIHNPLSFHTPLLGRLLEKVREVASRKPFFILLHFEHPAELAPETLEVVKMLKATGATLLSQTVFLKGINNDVETLRSLFEGLYFNGVLPYYIYRCDYVRGLEEFVCAMEEEVEIMTRLRSTLSGIACPLYIVDVRGKGKIPVPLGYWEGTPAPSCVDFEGERVYI